MRARIDLAIHLFEHRDRADHDTLQTDRVEKNRKRIDGVVAAGEQSNEAHRSPSFHGFQRSRERSAAAHLDETTRAVSHALAVGGYGIAQMFDFIGAEAIAKKQLVPLLEDHTKFTPPRRPRFFR